MESLRRSESGISKSETSIKVGFVSKPHGLQGFLKTTSLTDFPEKRFRVGATLDILYKSGSVSSCEIVGCKAQGVDFLIRFEGIESLEAAEAFRGAYLCVDSSQREALEAGDFYPDQLINLDLLASDGRPLGKILKVQILPGNPVLVVRSASGGGEFLVPFVQATIQQVDLEVGKVFLSPHLDWESFK
jgi:16S rRNA processing protein RimM